MSVISVDEFIKNNKKLLEQLRDEGEDKGAIGSMVHCFFDDERQIPLFFEVIQWKFGGDFSEIVEWLSECWNIGHENYLEFEKCILDNPLLALLMMGR